MELRVKGLNMLLLLFVAIAYLAITDVKLVMAAKPRRKPRQFLKIKQYEVQESKPSFLSPEEENHVFEETEGDEPQLLRHVTFKYPPYVLPPPIRLPSMKYEELHQISEYYQFLARESQGCSLDICTNPSAYINQFGSWNCAVHPNQCNSTTMLVMAERKYQVGSLDIIKNGFVSRTLDCGWPANHTKSLERQPRWHGEIVNATVIYLTVPEGLSFQHFIDGVVPKLVQLRNVLREENPILIMDKTFYDSMPRKLLERIGMNSTQIYEIYDFEWDEDIMKARKLILACQVPPLHPRLWQEAQELFRVSWLQPNWKQSRRIVLYLSRNAGNGRNLGRRVLNEEEVLNRIKPIVEENGRELVLFNSSEFTDLDSLFDFLANVDIVMGPHGGAFYNILFMRRNISVIEFVQDHPSFHSMRYAVHMIIYLQASLLGDNYYSVMGKAVNHDMTIDIDDLSSIVQHCLM